MWAGIETGNPDLFSLAMRFSPTGRRGTPWEIAASVGAGVRANPADPERVCRAGVDQARSSHDGAVEPAGLEHLEVPTRVVEHLRREGHQQEANDAVGHARAIVLLGGQPSAGQGHDARDLLPLHRLDNLSGSVGLHCRRGTLHMTEHADHGIRPAHRLLDRDPIKHVARHNRQAIGGLGDRLGTPGRGAHCVSGVERAASTSRPVRPVAPNRAIRGIGHGFRSAG